MRLPTESVLIVVVGLTGGSVLALGGLLATEARRTSADAGWVNDTNETRIELAGLAAALTDAETGQRGYLLTGDRAYLAPYHDADDRAYRHLVRLRGLTAGHPTQRDQLDELERLTRAKFAAMEQTITAFDRTGRDAALAQVRAGRGRELMDEFRAVRERMQAEQEGWLEVRRAVSDDRADRVGMVAAVLIAGAVAQMVFGLVLIRRDLAVRRRAEAQLREQAARDELTGLCNRRELERRLRVAATRHHAAGRVLSAVLVDVDYFKSVNDTHGHAVGDSVLQAVAARLASATRSEDVAARYGGEEFAVLLPGLGPTEAAAVAERARQTIAADPFAGRGDDGRPLALPLTASFGVACLYPSDGGVADLLLRRCDRALYQAKRAGRNQVIVFKDADTDTVQMTVRLPTPPPRTPV
ncbi:MAG TPA: diguanylate cyclase [Fimbriiglobus sp.]|jgi:diguanylate cyclase (GGDEF)-like protein|nr:diguanylate cyclase [Fimbriiglobus sp.]